MINSSLRLRTGMSNAILIEPGDTFQYTCQDGYFFQGSSTVTCFGDGSLRPVPLCYCKYFNHVHYFLLVSSSYIVLCFAVGVHMQDVLKLIDRCRPSVPLVSVVHCCRTRGLFSNWWCLRTL